MECHWEWIEFKWNFALFYSVDHISIEDGMIEWILVAFVLFLLPINDKSWIGLWNPMMGCFSLYGKKHFQPSNELWHHSYPIAVKLQLWNFHILKTDFCGHLREDTHLQLLVLDKLWRPDHPTAKSCTFDIGYYKPIGSSISPLYHL